MYDSFIMDRSRLTITLQPELLHQIDRTVDGARVRNRSHAIEMLLGKALSVDTVPVLILAGGKGIKNGHGEMPKGLIAVKGEPVLRHTLHTLNGQGFSRVIISLGNGGEKIRTLLDGTALTLTLQYLIQPKEIHGTAPAVRAALPMLGRQAFIVQYGDVYADIDYNELLEFHRAHRAFATVALTSVEHASMWGVATMQGARIVDFTEKPKSNAGKLSHLVNAGIYVLEPTAADLIGEGIGNLELTLFPRLAKEGRLYGYPFEGDWKDVGASG